MLQVTKEGTPEWIAIVENRIIDARHSYSPNAQKLIQWAVSRIEEPKHSIELPALTMSVKEFMGETGTVSNDSYRLLTAACDELMTHPIEVPRVDGQIKRMKFSWFDRAEYNAGAGTISFAFAPTMGRFLLGLKGQFTELPTRRFVQLRSVYAIRFLEKIHQQSGLKQPVWGMTLQGFEEWLATDILTYKFNMLVKRVIKPAQAELDERAEQSFDFEIVRDGRRVELLIFRIRPATGERAPDLPPRKVPKKPKQQLLPLEIVTSEAEADEARRKLGEATKTWVETHR